MPARQILVAEGLHPFYDERVRELMDFKIYLDISDEVKFAWKIQRDMAERGHSLESIKASIEARKPDFDAYIDIQKKYADVIIQARGPSVLGRRLGQSLVTKVLCSQCAALPSTWPVPLAVCPHALGRMDGTRVFLRNVVACSV